MPIRIKTPVLTWEYDSAARNRDQWPNPGHTQIPITIEHDQSIGPEPPVRINAMELTFSAFPILTMGGHWALQHNSSGSGFYGRADGKPLPSLWCRGMTPREGVEMVLGDPLRLGVQWWVEEPPGLASTPLPRGPLDIVNVTSGMNGWDWIRLTAQLYGKPRSNWADPNNWTVEITREPQLVGIVNVNTKYLLPGVYGLSTTKLTSDGTRRGTHFYGFSWPREEIPVVHHLGYIVIHPDAPMKQLGFHLDDGALGIVRSVTGDDAFEEFPIPTPTAA